MNRLTRFYQMPLAHKILVSRIVGWLIWFRICLWVLPFKIAKKCLPYENPKGLPELILDQSVIQNVANLVKVLSHYIPMATCLTQALTTKTILQKLGQESNLRFGVYKNDQMKFGAHAWIEINNRIIIGRQPDHYRLTVLNSTKSIII